MSICGSLAVAKSVFRHAIRDAVWLPDRCWAKAAVTTAADCSAGDVPQRASVPDPLRARALPADDDDAARACAPLLPLPLLPFRLPPGRSYAQTEPLTAHLSHRSLRPLHLSCTHSSVKVSPEAMGGVAVCLACGWVHIRVGVWACKSCVYETEALRTFFS